MGMFDNPQYLTGNQGLVSQGEEFMLLDAQLDGVVHMDMQEREQVRLVIQRTQDTQDQVCHTSGVAIVNQVKRMAPGDLPQRVKLDTVSTPNGHANVLVPV